MDFFRKKQAKRALGSYRVPELETPVPVIGSCENCRGSSVCNCTNCDTAHECGLCSGKGSVTVWPAADPLRIHPEVACVKTRDLAAAIHFAPDVCEILSDPSDDHSESAVWLVSEGFVAAVMPWRGEGEESFWEPIEETSPPSE